MLNRLFYCRGATLTSMMLIPLTVFGQSSSPQLETVTVTAQFREQDAQDVAISTAILDSEALRKQDIHGVNSLALQVPGVSYAEFAPGQALIAIRGIISADDGPGMDNSIAVFLDGIYIGRQATVNFDLYDIERIEILKGPQGTLFGRNAIGGAINIITKPPSHERQIKGSLTKGNYQATRLNAFASGSVSEKFSANLSVNLRKRAGFTRNVLLGKENQDEDTLSARTRWKYETGNTHILFNLDYTHDKRGDMGRVPIVNNGAFDYVQLHHTLGGGEHKSTAPIDGFSERDARGASLETNSQFKTGTLITIFGVRSASSDWQMASIGAPFNGGYDLENGIYGLDVNDDIRERISQQSAEARWIASSHDHFNYTLGAFALREKTHRIEQFRLDRNTVETGQVIIGNEIADQDNTTTALALYSHANWQLNEAWNLVFGARLSQDNKSIRTLSLNCGHQDNPIVARYSDCDVGSGSLAILQRSFDIETDHSWTDLSPKLAIEYHTQNTMTYGSISKGFKSGGFGGAPGVEEVANTPIKPENVWNYETGIKSDWLNNRLRVNASLFYMDYSNLQSVHFGPSEDNPDFGSFTTTNIDSTAIHGLELDSVFLINQYFDAVASIALLESDIKNFKLATAGGVVDLSGSTLRQAPESSYNLTLNSHLSLAKGSLHGQLSYHYKDEQISNYINQKTRIDELSLLNARVQWLSPSERWEIALWAKNLTDERYISHSYSIGPGVIGIWGEPRTMGLTLTWSETD